MIGDKLVLGAFSLELGALACITPYLYDSNHGHWLGLRDAVLQMIWYPWRLLEPCWAQARGAQNSVPEDHGGLKGLCLGFYMYSWDVVGEPPDPMTRRVVENRFHKGIRGTHHAGWNARSHVCVL